MYYSGDTLTKQKKKINKCWEELKATTHISFRRFNRRAQATEKALCIFLYCFKSYSKKRILESLDF